MGGASGCGAVIGSLRGTLVERVLRSDNQAEFLVEAGGVGYRVFVPAGSAAQAGEPGGQGFLWVHTHVREDAIVLYGFPTRLERDCFELLLGAHGVGPAVAVAVLSVLSPAALRRAVLSDDADALCLVPGIGKKTAARLVLDLAPRFEALPWAGATGDNAVVPPGAGGGQAARTGAAGADGTAGSGARGTQPEPNATGWSATSEEVRAALSSLGYGTDEVRAVVARLPLDGPAEELLRHALRELAGSR